jgi:hypothetical protein
VTFSPWPESLGEKLGNIALKATEPLLSALRRHFSKKRSPNVSAIMEQRIFIKFASDDGLSAVEPHRALCE